MIISELKNKFNEIYGEGRSRTFIAPARINIIGEHIDYNGGYVFPCAINLRSACIVRERKDNIIRLASTSYDGIVEADIERLEDYKNLEWGNYQIGVAYVMKQTGYNICGMDMLFDETIPHGCGLSSSAAIEMATAMAIASIGNDKVIDKKELAVICKNAENNYVGVNCGIMDQFASAMGKKDNAILLRCSDLEYKYVPFKLEGSGYSIVIMNTCKPRSLIKSKYNERRAECEYALQKIKQIKNIDNLCELSSDELSKFRDIIDNEECFKRVKHVVEENERVLMATKALKDGDLNTLGELMTKSHRSLDELYEVTGKELNALVYSALEQEGVLGARMTGAGFGGCALALVKDECVIKFCEKVKKKYKEETGLETEFYKEIPSDGAREELK